MPTTNTDLVNYYGKGYMTSASHYRGELLSCSTTFTEGPGAATQFAVVGDILAVMPIRYNSVVKRIKIIGSTPQGTTTGTGDNGAAISVGIYALDDTSRKIGGLISNNLLAADFAVGNQAALNLNILLKPLVATNSIYSLLCDTSGKPINAFAPYAKNQYGILTFTVANAAITGTAVGAGNLLLIDVEYVEQRSSIMPKTYNYENPQEARDWNAA